MNQPQPSQAPSHYDDLERRDPQQREADLMAALSRQVAHAKATSTAQAQPEAMPDPRGDAAAQEMAQVFRQGQGAAQRQRLAQLLPQLRGHLLEPWGAYWELRARLDTASPQEVQDFLARYAGTYQEDRLRNDWLLLLGQRRDWTTFAEEHPRFRMNDDPQVRCYALLVQQLREGTTPALLEEVRRLWFAQREAEDACSTAARTLVNEAPRATRLTTMDVWRRARLAAEYNKPRAAAQAVEIVAPAADALAMEAIANPQKFLASKVVALSRARKEVIVLALVRLAATVPSPDARLAEPGEAATDVARRAAAGWTGAVAALADAAPAPVVVDAVFGTGLSRPLDPDLVATLRRLRAAARIVIAADVPSGVETDSGADLGAVAADVTVALAALKPAHLLQPGAALDGACNGLVHVGDQLQAGGAGHGHGLLPGLRRQFLVRLLGHGHPSAVPGDGVGRARRGRRGHGWRDASVGVRRL